MDSLFTAADGGILHISRLRSLGYSRGRLAHDLQAGRLIRVRRGIYAQSTAAIDTIRAARIGGRLAGVSATSAAGLWTPPRHPLTVEVSAWASRLRDPDDATVALAPRRDVLVIWGEERRRLADSLGIASLGASLQQVASTLRPEQAVAVIDSALHLGLLDRMAWETLVLGVPESHRLPFRLADGRSESGTESVVRVALARVGVRAEPQVPVPFTDLDRLDLLIGDRLVIECDSEAHHGDPSARRRDLERDARLAALGFVVLRFDYRQVMFDLPSVLAAILSMVQRGLHLERP